MTEAGWKLNDASVANGAVFTRDSGSLFNIYNGSGGTLTGTSSSPTPQEGAYCYGITNNADAVRITYPTPNTTNYLDYMIYMPTGAGYSQPNVNYGSVDGETEDPIWFWMGLNTDNSMDLALYYASFDYYQQLALSSTNAFPRDEWFRVSVGYTYNVNFTYAAIFRGTNLLGTTPSTYITPTAASAAYTINSYFGSTTNGGTYYIDDIILNDTTAPSRGTAPGLVAYGPSIRR